MHRGGRILLVHSQLAQHGSERLLYEIAKILQHAGHQVDVLTRPFGIRHQYYYSILRTRGILIRRRLVTFRHFTYLLKRLRRSRSFAGKAVRMMYALLARILYFNLINEYDRTVVIGMETYCDTFAFLRGRKNSIIVHHVMHAFQQDRAYGAEFDLPSIIVHDVQQEKQLLAERPDLRMKKIRLPYELPKFKPLLNTTSDQEGSGLRIGVVSRLRRDRPNAPLFEHFAEVSANLPATLHFFGDGDPALYEPLLKELHIDRRRVEFHGHAHDLLESFQTQKIDIAWSVTMGGSISYAAIELIAKGIPVFLINIDPDAAIPPADSQSLWWVNSPEETVVFHTGMLKQRQKLAEMLLTQQAAVKKQFDAEALAEDLLHIYELK